MSKTWIGRAALPALALAAAALGGQAVAAAPADAARIAREIKSEVAQQAAGINAHDPVRATAFEAPDVLVMQSGSPNLTGVAADRADFKGLNPTMRITMVQQSVDVAAAGDMAVYRSIFRRDLTRSGAAWTGTANFVAGFKRQADGSWKIAWYVLSPIDQLRKK
jgi:ketosteroid isomerase-like protein